ncbi:MAG: cell division ATP-binding protein FtsE [Ignavibacteria bacterium RIFOXYB2_FULL_36_7]|nr:MAG: cell division ATP-binding protein FtsE [Ignavibacteria bacterium RIFOXYB2_FULL_36_7]
MLSFNNVDFGYPHQPVFTDLNLNLEKGEFCFLIGKSGSGKSTILQLIYMNIFPDSGIVQVDEYNSKTIKPGQLPYLRRKLGVVFQDFKLLRDRDIYDNLAFVLEVIKIPRNEIRKRVINALTEVGLAHRKNSKPDELSGGEKQRIAIARAVINEPVLLLADEPTGNLDPETSYEIVEIFRKINLKGTAVLFATHNYEIVKKYNAKIIKIENGQAFRGVLKQREE